MSEEGEAETCWLCGRAFGRRIELHHPVPRAKRGRETVKLHPICHRAIHANFTNRQLQQIGGDAEAIRRNAAVAKFVNWVATKPSDFHAPTRKGR